MSTPDFSPVAREYARSRPGYPEALFTHLAALVDRRELAWDCATGSGQAAHGLAPLFARVVATDVSAAQLEHARPGDRIEYRRAAAEASGLTAASVDLVTVAAAIHWLDLSAFGAEVERVARPGGVVAAWTYHVAIVDPPFDEVFSRFYWQVARPWFSDRVRLVDDRYEGLELPGTPLPSAVFRAEARWSLATLREFVRTWSGTRSLLADGHGELVAELDRELGALWGDPTAERTLRWPLFLRAARL
ncbi:MAG: class I SAM-dependent methyltransferase [Thermoanaerobaculia bacterium]